MRSFLEYTLCGKCYCGALVVNFQPEILHSDLLCKSVASLRRYCAVEMKHEGVHNLGAFEGALASLRIKFRSKSLWTDPRLGGHYSSGLIESQRGESVRLVSFLKTGWTPPRRS